jgi:hypothetical protein
MAPNERLFKNFLKSSGCGITGRHTARGRRFTQGERMAREEVSAFSSLEKSLSFDHLLILTGQHYRNIDGP